MKLIQFDTLNKKPKLYGLLIPVLMAITAIIMLSQSDLRHFIIYSCIVMILLCASIVIGLLIAFNRQLRYNPYSYNTIYYMGFALFTVFVLISYLVLEIRVADNPEVYRISEIIHMILGSAKNFMLFTSPFILIFSIALCISNISLIRHEGKSLSNVLGIILSFLLVAGVVFLFVFDYSASGSIYEVMVHDLVINTFAAVYLYFECMLLGVIIADAIVVTYEPEPDKDFIIVLGCGLFKDGTPPPLLRGRLDRALEFARKQEELTGKKAVFVTSGGQGPDEIMPESRAMKNYLMEHGIEEERIIEENRSTDTMENMANSKEIIQSINPNAKVIFSTTNYHVFRSGLCARRVKMRATGIGARTKWYFWPNAAVREFVGLLTSHKIKQAVILVSMIVFYIVLTLYAYLILK